MHPAAQTLILFSLEKKVKRNRKTTIMRKMKTNQHRRYGDDGNIVYIMCVLYVPVSMCISGHLFNH